MRRFGALPGTMTRVEEGVRGSARRGPVIPHTDDNEMGRQISAGEIAAVEAAPGSWATVTPVSG